MRKIPTSQSKFRRGDRVRHKTAGVYVILQTPDTCRLRWSVVGAYLFRMEGGKVFWILDKEEMENGQYKLTGRAFWTHVVLAWEDLKAYIRERIG